MFLRNGIFLSLSTFLFWYVKIHTFQGKKIGEAYVSKIFYQWPWQKKFFSVLNSFSGTLVKWELWSSENTLFGTSAVLLAGQC